MNGPSFPTSVVLVLFKRPETTRQVFDVIRQVRPTRLFLIADGPRNPEEQVLCEQARAVVSDVDWPCEVVTNFATYNLGLRRRLSSGITWVFEQVEEAIILEDDCLPHPTFFRFCSELLERYRSNPQVMHISGDCFVNLPARDKSYYFTRYAHVWGWATWRRAWVKYDSTLARWEDPATRNKVLSTFSLRSERRFWEHTLDAVQRGEIDTWDYQWTFTLMAENAMAINPSVNLVGNVGFGNSATNTIDTTSGLANLPVAEMSFPLIHPMVERIEAALDVQTASRFFTREAPLQRKLRSIYGRLSRTIGTEHNAPN